MAFLLKKEDFPLFVKLLMKSYDVIAPVEKKNLYVFSEIKSHKEIKLDKNTYYPPKKFFLPQKEDLFKFKKKKTLLGTKKEVIESIFNNKKKVIFGVRMCDVSSINKMDNFYLGEDEDIYYKQRRENIFIIAMKCNSEENDNCFCSSFKHDDTGYDLFFEKIQEGFIVDVKTKKGKDFIDKKIFKASAREVNKDLPICNKRLKTDLIPNDSPKWNKYAEKCLSCSSCNIVCPTCGCFDIKDYPNLDLKSGKRVRIWDYCQSADYTRVAGNHIFRQGRLERFKHRLQCKFTYFKNNFDEITCTGCGRCITVCPADICDIPEIISDLNE